MSTAAIRSTASLAVPPTQNTAPVLEFNCLYTHDIRRKQKRWQDGLLRFHTFNKRAMVYDMSRNFIGSAHWTAGDEINEGDEITLDKEAVMVEVAENIGRTETDLTELRKSRKKNVGKVISSPLATADDTPIPKKPEGNSMTQSLSLKHKSLHKLLGPSKGKIGSCSLPTKSPFEERQIDCRKEAKERERAPKRQRTDKATSRSVIQTMTAVKQRKRSQMQPGQQRLTTCEVIDLNDDVESEKFLPGFSSDALVPVSPVGEVLHGSSRERPSSTQSSSRAIQTHKTHSRNGKRNRLPVANDAENDDFVLLEDEHGESLRSSVGAAKTRRRRSIAHSSTTDLALKSNLEQSTRVPNALSSREQTQGPPAAAAAYSAAPKPSICPVVREPKKRTLLCQDQFRKKPKTTLSFSTENEFNSHHEGSKNDIEQPSRMCQRQHRINERLARIGEKEAIAAMKQTTANVHGGVATQATQQANKATTMPLDVTHARHEDPALELARLDQVITPPEPPAAERTGSLHKPSREGRSFRRVVSDTTGLPPNQAKDNPVVPENFAGSPSLPKRDHPGAVTLTPLNAVAFSKSGAKTPFQRAVSLNALASGTSAVLLSRPFQPPKSLNGPDDVAVPAAASPWSREAFDLFDWRPPEWDEERWCLRKIAGEVATTDV